MGDDFDDYDFIKNINYKEDDDDDDDIDDNDNDDNDNNNNDNDDDDNNNDDDAIKRAEEKKLKKKRKLKEAKEKKKQKLSDSKVDSNNNRIDDMYKFYNDNKTHRYNNGNNDFTIDNFYDSTSTNENIKFKCPYSKAIAIGLGIDTFKKTLLKESNDYGQPQILIVTPNTDRAVALCKTLPQNLGLNKLKVSKLFAKHLKISEQMESLSKSHFAIGVGTPNRLSKLISLGALRLNEVKLVIIDVEPDEKNFTILTMPNVKDDFYEFMNYFKSSSSSTSSSSSKSTLISITMINTH